MKKLVLIGLMLGLGSCGVARADVHNAAKKSTGKTLQDKISQANLSLDLYGVGPEYSNAAAEKSISSIPGLYSSGLLAPTVGNYVLSQLLLKYAHSSPADAITTDRSIQACANVQVGYLNVIASQNQILIEQNKQMITLLTKIANKK